MIEINPIILALLPIVSALLTALIAPLFGRRLQKSQASKVDADAGQVTADIVKLLQTVYQDMIKDLTTRVGVLEGEQSSSGVRIAGLEKVIEEYKQIVTSLLAKIDTLEKQVTKLGGVPGNGEGVANGSKVVEKP